MNNEEETIRGLLSQALPPMQNELQRDLWPKMLGRMNERAPTVPWFDWALIVLLIGAIAVSPHSIPLLLYHF
jgi:hypothetical protein